MYPNPCHLPTPKFGRDIALSALIRPNFWTDGAAGEPGSDLIRVHDVHVAVDSFEELFRESYPRLVALGTSMSGDREVARDLAQETMLRAYRRWDEVGEYEYPGGWLRRVMSNLLIDHHRSTTSERSALDRIKHAPSGPHAGDADPAQLAIGGSMQRWTQLTASLTPQQRVIATLFYGEDASIENIAQTLDLSQGAVKSALFKARRNLERARREGDRDG